MDTRGRILPWRLVLLILLTQIAKTEAFCGDLHICIHTKTSQRKASYAGSSFPNLKDLFNVSLDTIESLEIKGSNIETLNPKELGKLTNLRRLYIDHSKKLSLPDYAFQNNKELTLIRITNCEIKQIRTLAFDGAFQKKSINGELNLKGNKLTYFPIFTSLVPGLRKLSLDKNPIIRLTNASLNKLDQIEILSMRETSLVQIEDDVFKNKDHLVEFNASGSTSLSEIAENAFRGAKSLKILNLDGSIITKLPSKGLDHLVHLSLKGVTTIKAFSDDFINLPKLSTVHLAQERRYLCCAFKYKRKPSLHEDSGAKVNFTRDCSTGPQGTIPQTYTSSSGTTKTPSTSNVSRTTTDPWGGWGRKRRALLWFGDWIPSNNATTDAVKTGHPHFTDGNFGKNTVTHKTVIFRCANNSNVTLSVIRLDPVNCYPEPDALRPCDDIMGNVYLTSISWIVSFIAVLTNGIVFGVLVMSRRQFTVTKFLIINLAFADLCLGLYLFVLTCASIDTTGKYYNSVYSWQYDGGCDVVGFLAVFSSELSMLILTIITIERYLAIVYAVYLQKRLTLRHASYLAAAAWIVAILMAILPLAGVNSYQDVAICLPFRIATAADIVYLAFVFGFNSLLFLLIMGCYIKIYLAVAGPYSKGRPPAQTNDSSIAKRIALLVFTDFACWLPIAVIGMIAAAGQSSSINMTVEKSKYLLVIFFPINSVCNPFLYALSTRTFQREFFTVLAQCGFCRERLHQFNTNTYTGNGNTTQRRNQSKTRRGTETINLSVAGTANCTSTPKPGVLATNSVAETKRINSPTEYPLMNDSVPVSPAQNNNQPSVHEVTPVHLVNDHNSNTSLDMQDQPVTPRLDRATSRTPLSENFDGTVLDQSIVETEIVF